MNGSVRSTPISHCSPLSASKGRIRPAKKKGLGIIQAFDAEFKSSTAIFGRTISYLKGRLEACNVIYFMLYRLTLTLTKADSRYGPKMDLQLQQKCLCRFLPSIQLYNNLSCPMIIHVLKLSNVSYKVADALHSMFMHVGQPALISAAWKKWGVKHLDWTPKIISKHRHSWFTATISFLPKFRLLCQNDRSLRVATMKKSKLQNKDDAQWSMRRQ